MIDDMTARRFGETVRKDYVRHVETLAAFLGRLFDAAGEAGARGACAGRQASVFSFGGGV